MPLRTVTESELAQHRSAEDIWVAVHGLVWDVTRFLPDHPGGPEVVEAVAGKEASSEFEDALHSAAARREKTMKLVGVLEGCEARVEGLRAKGWTEDQGIPDVDALGAGSGAPMGGMSSTITVVAGVVALSAVAVAFMMRRK